MKAIALISGGIDSPVAAYLMAQKGYEVIGLYFDSNHYSDDFATERALRTMDRLHELTDNLNVAYIMPHGDDLDRIKSIAPDKLTCVYCHREMYRKAELLAHHLKADVIVSGEIIGEQASQTVRNLFATTDALQSISIVRPLIAMNKDEVIKISQRIETFELNKLPGQCCLAVPNKPETKAELRYMTEYTQEINQYIHSLDWDKIRKITFPRQKND
jgi:thiamine biosynthesis protein ThiI